MRKTKLNLTFAVITMCFGSLPLQVNVTWWSGQTGARVWASASRGPAWTLVRFRSAPEPCWPRSLKTCSSVLTRCGSLSPAQVSKTLFDERTFTACIPKLWFIRLLFLRIPAWSRRTEVTWSQSELVWQGNTMEGLLVHQGSNTERHLDSGS